MFGLPVVRGRRSLAHCTVPGRLRHKARMSRRMSTEAALRPLQGCITFRPKVCILRTFMRDSLRINGKTQVERTLPTVVSSRVFTD